MFINIFMFIALYVPSRCFVHKAFYGKAYVIVLACNAFSLFYVLRVVMVDDMRQYELHIIEHNCLIVKGSDYHNSFFYKIVW
jgi:hypothetical protein